MDGFSIVSQIGAGSYGIVLLAQTTNASQDRFVLKQIDLRKLSQKEKTLAFEEATILSQVGGHPNIVTFHRSFQDNHHLIMVMDYCDKGDLYGAVQKQLNYNRKHGLKLNSYDYRYFPEAQIWDWFMQICLAVRYLHNRHILHRDLKLQNIFLTSDGLIKVGDFGIAKILNGAVDMTRTCIGTPFYLSPEICENKPYDTKTDIWSLGCLLYEMSALRHPFYSTSMKSLLLKITRVSYQPLPTAFSTTLRGLVGQLLRQKAEDRPDIHQILARTFVRKRLTDWLPKQQRADELHEIYANGMEKQMTLHEDVMSKNHSRKHRRLSLSPQKSRFKFRSDSVGSLAENMPTKYLRADGKARHVIQAKNLYELQELANASLSEAAEDENGNRVQEESEASKVADCCEEEEAVRIENDKSCRKCGRAKSVPKKSCRKCSSFNRLDLHQSCEKTTNSAITRQSADELRLTLTALLGGEVYKGLYQKLISDRARLRDGASPLFKESPLVGEMFRELLIAECVDDLSAT
uniref:non-specific serine/threonine protein kinase n=1 Tax=Plectus sambesii TaxID=2011161 RepID=A0A914W2G2_9BILA